ncbi:MAG: T9SS type A sorting domain-containing protein [Cytophagaceae bacterium]|nr:T9SS type A sorting domain-containing protein [Cytophagaceae bacterium]
MKKALLVIYFACATFLSFGQLPPGGQWGCPSIPMQGEFDTTCFQRAGELKLGQGYFDHYGTADPVYLVIPQNRPSYAIAIAVAWNYYRNTLGHDKMSINQWFATMGQENGFATYNGVQLPTTIFDVEAGANVAIPCTYPRGCNSNTCAGAGYCWHVSQNGDDGPYQNTLAGYQTISPYVPTRYPGPAATYQQLYNSNMEMASMNKTFYDLSIYRRAQLMNGVDLAAIEGPGNDIYGIEAAQAVAYNLGPNAAQAISVPGYTLPAGIATNTNWATSYYSGGVSCYAQRVAAMTAILDNNEAMGKADYNASGCGSANNWDFYSFYDSQIKWDTVLASVNRLLLMYPDVNAPLFRAAVQTAFNKVDADANGFISYRYEMGAVIDAIVMNLPKDDPGFSAQYAINGTGCKLDCRAPYTTIKPSGPTTICVGQSVILNADVDSPTPSTTYQWLKNGAVIAGATSATYTVTPAAAGTDVYSVIVCWSAFKESNGAVTTCCSEPQCDVTIVTQASCSNCAMNITLTPTANACTGMPNGSIAVAVTGIAVGMGPFEYIWSGPSSGTFTSALLNYTIPNLRDGKYTVHVRRVADVNCRAIKDVWIIPTTPIKESLTATAANGTCPVQLNAILINQKPNTCNMVVSYGALNAASWDRSFFMDLKVNGVSALTMFESYPAAGTRDDPWDWWPFTWPTGGAGNAPNVKTVTVNDGDTLSVFGITLVPQGTPVPAFIDGGVVLEGTGLTFRQVGMVPVVSNIGFRYRGVPLTAPAPVIAPTNGSRQMQNSYIVTCPVVAPPAYTYSWSPATGLDNPNIQNPNAGVSGPTTYTVTATHPGNPACQLTAQATATTSCAPLPVQMVYFNAVLIDHEVELEWVTVSEKNCKEFQIERSKDGIHFEVIGAVACNNSSGISTYKFYDEHPYYGISYYRLAQYDIDGSIAYSEIKEIEQKEISASIYPNPFYSHFTVALNGGEEEYTLKAFDVHGRLLEQKIIKGNGSVMLGSDWAAGVYVIQISDGYAVKNYKLVKN